MLVITRKAGETINIGNNVYVRVVATASGRVKIGIEAPRNVSITRSELAQPEADELAMHVGCVATFDGQEVQSDFSTASTSSRRPR